MIMTDFHSHILPGIDDGSKSVEESIKMLRMEAEQGITHVVVTPHFYPQHDSPERFLKRRAEAEVRLRQAMAAESGLPDISVGAEIYFFHGISDSDAISQLTINKKRCILIEMPPPPWTGKMFQELEALAVKRGYLPIVAHIDRYISRFRTFGIPDRLAELPVLVQANADFFLDRSTASMALRMLRAGKIHLLGSDCHNLVDRKPNLGSAVARICSRLGDSPVAQINACAADVLSGEM